MPELNKNELSSVLGTGYFLKSQKVILSKKNQPVLIAEISSHKTQKIANPQKYSRKNFVPQGRCDGLMWL